MKIRRNQTGMTLIELIVSLLILSIASLMFYSSFQVVLRTMREGNEIKNATNSINAAIDGDRDATENKGIVSANSERVELTLQDGTKLSVSGTMFKGSLSYSDEDTITLSRFTSTIYALTENEKKAITFIQQIQSVYGIGLNKEGVDYINNLRTKDPAFDAKVRGWIGQSSFYPNNDVFRNFLYFGYFNDINHTTNYKWPVLDISNMRLKDGTTLYSMNGIQKTNTYYIQPYFHIPSTKDGYIIHANLADNPITSAKKWETRFIFNPDDQHWYFRKTGNLQIAGTGTLGSCTNADTTSCANNWNTIKSNMMKGLDGWERIYEDE